LKINYVTRDIHSYGILNNVDGWFITDVSVEPIVPIFKGHAAEEEFFFDWDGNNRFSRNVDKKLSSLAS